MSEIGRLSVVASNSIAVSVSAVASASIELFLSAYVARKVGADAMGTFYLVAAVISYLALVCNPGLTVIAQRQIAKRPQITSSLVRLITALQLVIGLVAYFGLGVLVYLFAPTNDFLALALIGAHVLILAPLNLLWVLQAHQRMVWPAVATLLVDLSHVALVVAVIDDTASVVTYAWTFVPILIAKFICYGMVLRRANIPAPVWKPRLRGWRPIVMASLPLGISLGATLIYYNADTLVLGIFRSNTEIGLYGAAYGLMILMAGPSFAVNRAFFPELSRRYAVAKAQGAEVSASFSSVLAWLGLPLGALGIVAGEYLFVAVYGPSFQEGSVYFRILCINFILINVAMGLGTPLVAWGYQAVHMRITVASAVLNLVLNFLLIPFWGGIGAAIATIASEVFVTLAIVTFRIRNQVGLFAAARVYAPPLLVAAVLALILLAFG